MTLDATVVIPAFNGEEFLEELIQAVLSQKSKRTFEILLIDSGSNDATLDIARRHKKVRIHEIPNKEFGHGRTRNLGADLANSEFVIFLTQDAVPSHDKWLDYMLEPFTISPKVACVFGKQIPRAHCFVTLKREVDQVFKSFCDDGSISLQRKTDITSSLGITNNFLSDVNSAVRKSAWKKTPFRDVNYAEDQALGIDMLDANLIKAYAPLGSVFHSHDYPLKKYSRRKFDEYIGLRKSTGYTAQVSTREIIVGTTKATVQDWVYIARDKEFYRLEKLHDFFLAPAYNLATRLAIRRAAKTQSQVEIEKYSLETAARKKAKR